jgi:hypothetical protein
MDMRMPRDSVSCSLITQNYRVNGKVSVTAAGLVGLANDTNSSFIELEDASLVRLHRPQEIVAQFNVWNMVKARIIAILCERTADLGRISIARAGFQRQISYRVWGSVHGFEVFGILECPGKFDFSSQIFQGGNLFGSLFNATLIPVFFPQLVTRSPAILYNRQMVEGMGVISEVEESEYVEARKLGGTGPIPRGGTGQLPRRGTGSLPSGGTGQLPRGGPGSSSGGTGPFESGGS